jgi:hypothetical protein
VQKLGTSANFGYLQAVSLRGRPWLDVNGNGLGDEAPVQGLGGVTIIVYQGARLVRRQPADCASLAGLRQHLPDSLSR